MDEGVSISEVENIRVETALVKYLWIKISDLEM